MKYFECGQVPSFAALAGLAITFCSAAAFAQARQGTVSAQSLAVYSKMSTDSDQVATLQHGAAVQILFSVTTGDGSWCSVANANSNATLGYVLCEELAIETAPDATPPILPSAMAAPGALPTREQKAWALAASAIASTINRAGTSTLAANTSARARQALAVGWEVHNRDDLFNALNDLEVGRERATLSVLGQRASALSDADFNKALSRMTPSQAKVAKMVRRNYPRYQSQDFTGWDYARYIDVCRWGVSAGYIAPDEAWPRVMNAARIIQRRFTSWQEFGQNYLAGWEIFPTAIVEGPLQESPHAAYEWLIGSPSSPWRQIPWNLPLE